MFEFSMWRCSDDLRERALQLHNASKKHAKHYIELWKQIPQMNLLGLYWEMYETNCTMLVNVLAN